MQTESSFIFTNGKGLTAGGFEKKLSKAALALAELYCVADLGNRKTLITQLIARTHNYFTDVLGWPVSDTSDVIKNLLDSMPKNTKLKNGEFDLESM